MCRGKTNRNLNSAKFRSDRQPLDGEHDSQIGRGLGQVADQSTRVGDISEVVIPERQMTARLDSRLDERLELKNVKLNFEL